MDIQQVTSIIGILGIGGLVASYATYIFEKRNTAFKEYQSYKETRYKCIIMLMVASLDFENRAKTLKNYGYELNNVSDLKDILKDEYINGVLFASDEFLISFKDFLLRPSNEALIKTALAIRADLWGTKSKISLKQLLLHQAEI